MLHRRHLTLRFLIRAVRSILLSRSVDEATTQIPLRVDSHALKVHILKAPGARLDVKGIVSLVSFQGGVDPIYISLGANSRLLIDGDFIIGSGTRIVLDNGASLRIGGRRAESGAGITERSRIMVKNRVTIGHDCIIAWNVFITDCDWHAIEGKAVQRDVTVGDHVWIAASSSILKGSRIGNGSIIAAHTVVRGEEIPERCAAGGNPLRIIETGVTWHRDMSGWMGDTEKPDTAER